ncbi:MAG TPA: methyltransferase domain-containing protein [Nevskiaceae bacterium]|nr:methyltransferase domain-containing protein [Nevskiaceae bacterium]
MSLFICPLCREALQQEPTRWCCARGHSFDVAREGYVNLLPVQHKNSREPGDALDSLQARRAFLEAGHYAPLRDALVAQAALHAPRHALDVGCGEGWYTGALATVAGTVVGLDIAKPAIRLAARRYPRITWLVGSGVSLPIADGTVDVATSVFSQLYPNELHRVLAPGGQAIVVTPAPDHLWALREGLFEEVRPHAPDKFLTGLDPLFDLRERLEVRAPLRLGQDAIRQLVLMTPYAWKAKPARRAEVESRSELLTDAVFTLMCFARKDA